MATVTNIIHINNVVKDYDITSVPVFNMRGFLIIPIKLITI